MADKYGYKLKFYYNSSNVTKMFDYAITADNRRFNMTYWSGYEGDDALINGKLKSVEGPFRVLDNNAYEAVDGATRKMELTYTVEYGRFGTGYKNYVLLETVTDMGGRFFTYDYVMTNLCFANSSNYSYVVSAINPD